jgi:hypothetical protein
MNSRNVTPLGTSSNLQSVPPDTPWCSADDWLTPHAPPRISPVMPPRTPGALGRNDAADPSRKALLGDTPGPVGKGDHAAARAKAGRREKSVAPPTAKAPAMDESSEFAEFKAKVLAEEIAMRTRRGRKHFAAVPESELVVVEGDKKMRKEAAARLQVLLAKARADLKAEQEAFTALPKEARDAARAAAWAKGEVAVSDVKRIWVQSAYRDFKYDEDLWHRYFKEKYYPKTKAKRAELKGGPHGDAAVRYLAKYISGKKAPPGFSNHSDGRAVDFGTHEGDTKLVGGSS